MLLRSLFFINQLVESIYLVVSRHIFLNLLELAFLSRVTIFIFTVTSITGFVSILRGQSILYLVALARRLGENIHPSQSTCQVKSLELLFFQFYIQGFQYFCIKLGKSFIKKANKIIVMSMTCETSNDRSTFLFFMLKSVRVVNFMNKF